MVASGLGDPGQLGEWMSLSNRYKPPVGRPLTVKVEAVGVGMVGIDGAYPLG